MAKYNDFANDHRVVMDVGQVSGQTPGLDCKGLEQVVVVLRTGNVPATGTIDAVVEHSDDDGSVDPYTTLSGAVFAQLVDADDNVTRYGIIKTNTAGVKRWLRVNTTVANAAEYGVAMIGKNISGHLPVTVNALPAPEFSLNQP